MIPTLVNRNAFSGVTQAAQVYQQYKADHPKRDLEFEEYLEMREPARGSNRVGNAMSVTLFISYLKEKRF